MATTQHGFDPEELQEAIVIYLRRGMELEAMECAAELTVSGFDIMACLELFAVEEIAPTNYEAIMHVSRLHEIAKSRPVLPNALVAAAVITICRSPKSREAYDLGMIVGKRQMDGVLPVIPEAAVNIHTQRGRKIAKREAARRKMPVGEYARRKFLSDWGKTNHPVKDTGSRGENHSEDLWHGYGLDAEHTAMLGDSVTNAEPYHPNTLNPQSTVRSLGNGLYDVQSSSDPNKSYIVDIHAMNCTCPAYRHAKQDGHCKHIMRVIEEIRGEHDEPTGIK